MERGKGKGEVRVGLPGKRTHFRSRSNSGRYDQDCAGFKEGMGSELHRNRSLKQLFGELPTIAKNTSQFTSRDRGGNSQIKQNGEGGKEQKKGEEGVKRRNCKIQDEYLLKKPRKRERQGGQKQSETGEGKEQLGNKKIDRKAVQQLIVKKDHNSPKMQTYNPAAYYWRNTPSKEKKDRLAKHPLSPRMPALVQSEYFPSLNNSDKNQVEGAKGRKKEQNSKQMTRSISSDSVRKLSLRPRVVKHIFQPRSPGRRQDSLPKGKKSLLFTFGL